MKNRIIRAAALLLIAAMLPATAAAAEQHTLAGKLVRLHVIANSDLERDQQLKLAVRDAVLEFTDGMDESTLCESLDGIRDVSQRTLAERGCSCQVRVLLGDESYPTRHYDSFALPAGRYRSLRVEIGDAEGKNWWCVIFPPLCYATSEELVEQASAAGLDKDELKFITESGEEVQIRFRILELIQKLAQFLFN